MQYWGIGPHVRMESPESLLRIHCVLSAGGEYLYYYKQAAGDPIQADNSRTHDPGKAEAAADRTALVAGTCDGICGNCFIPAGLDSQKGVRG